MKKYFSISQTAKIVNMTAEALRHYDRIGLIKPSKVDEMTGYRYYNEQDIVSLNTVSALRCMEMSLSEIKKILNYDDFDKIAESLTQCEKQANKKLAEINYAKTKIQAARMFYESKYIDKDIKGIYIKEMPKRVILLSENVSEPTLNNLWDYHRHFYKQIGESQKNDFSFEDLAGIYESKGKSCLFAVCTRYSDNVGLKVLPKGKYLCADCTDKTRDVVLNNLLKEAKKQYSVNPDFITQIIVLSGILKWNYQIQILID